MMLLLISFINQAINPDVQLEFGPGRAGPGRHTDTAAAGAASA